MNLKKLNKDEFMSLVYCQADFLKIYKECDKLGIDVENVIMPIQKRNLYSANGNRITLFNKFIKALFPSYNSPVINGVENISLSANKELNKLYSYAWNNRYSFTSLGVPNYLVSANSEFNNLKRQFNNLYLYKVSISTLGQIDIDLSQFKTNNNLIDNSIKLYRDYGLNIDYYNASDRYCYSNIIPVIKKLAVLSEKIKVALIKLEELHKFYISELKERKKKVLDGVIKNAAQQPRSYSPELDNRIKNIKESDAQRAFEEALRNTP